MKRYIPATAVMVSGIYIKTLWWMTGTWIMNPYFSSGAVAAAAAIYFAIKNYFSEFNFNGSTDGLLLFFAAVMLHIYGNVTYQYWISASSYPLALFGAFRFISKDFASRCRYPLFLLLLAVPYPVYSIINFLEAFSAKIASTVLSIIGIKTVVTGAEIRTASNSFTVGAPCSGIRSLFALTTVTAIYLYYSKSKNYIKVLVFTISLPLALAANIMRIISVIYFAEKIGVSFAMKYVHYPADALFFILAVLFIAGLDRRLSSCSEENSL